VYVWRARPVTWPSALPTYHRHSYSRLQAGHLGLLRLARRRWCEYNGIEKAHHVRDKLTELMNHRGAGPRAGLAASMKGQPMTSGTYLPDLVYANVGKYYAGHEPAPRSGADPGLAGGLLVTMPSEEDYRSREWAGMLKKYLGRAAIVASGRSGALLPADRGLRVQFAGWRWWQGCAREAARGRALGDCAAMTWIAETDGQASCRDQS